MSSPRENRITRVVKAALVKRDYVETAIYRKQVFTNRTIIGGRQFFRQALVGKTIYERERKCDYYIVNKKLFPKDLIIECIWQRSKGSVDEKYPYLLFNIVKTGVPTVIILDGGGYKPTALAWLKEQSGRTGSLRSVWTISEFETAVNHGFLETK